MNEGRILVIRGGAIGDFILTLPVLSALRRRFPAARLEVLGYSHIAGLAVAEGLADAVRSIEAGALAGFFAGGAELDPGLREYFARFDVIVSYLFDPDGVFAANVGRCGARQFIAGPHRPDESAGIHATWVYLKPLERLAIFDADPVPRLQVGQGNAALEPGSPARAGGCRRLALHPGSGSETKNWPEVRWAELLDRLAADESMDFLVVGGEAEGARLERLRARLPASRTRVARSLPLPELAAEVAKCDLFLGHDSGISHLAAALERPALVLWGHTAEAVWRPAGARVRVLRHPAGLSHLPAAEVLAELMQLAGGA
jgi:heptosyltransferase III